jgi:glutathione S-transferase
MLEEDGRKISSSPAIAFHLGQTYDLLPDTPEGRVLAIGLIDHVDDFKNGHNRIIWHEDDAEKARKWWLDRKANWLGFLENLLMKTKYLTGNKITYADICVFQLLHDMFVRPFKPEYSGDLDGHALVRRFVNRILEESPGIAEHIKTRPEARL